MTNPAEDPITHVAFGDPNPAGLLYKLTVNNNECVPPPPPTHSNVHIFKYVDGALATSAGVGGISFPMYTATYSAPFTLGPSGWTAGDVAYEASTGEKDLGFDYTTNEDLSTSLVGASCDGSHSYALVGYTTGSTLVAAEGGTPTLTVPAFTDLDGDGYIIVWNTKCEVTPPTTLKVHILKYLDGGMATAETAGGYQFPMTATWNAANIGAGTGTYVLGNNHGGAPDQYGADTSPMSAPADYTTSEITSNIDASSNVLPVGAECVEDKYRLLGYKSSATSFADAAVQTLSTSTPVFTGLTTDEYVLVLNQKCTAPVIDKLNAEIRGYKVEDRDAKGHHPRLSGWTIYLDANDNGALDTDEASTTTNTSGNFRFSGLAAGTYHVREVAQDGWGQTTPASGVYDVTLAPGEKLGAKNKDRLVFSNFEYGSIAGIKYEDMNYNGKKDVNEPTLAGWTIELYTATSSTDTTGTLASTTTTGSDGAYRFGPLTPSWYRVHEVMQDGWTNKHPDKMIHLDSGENITNADFGNRVILSTKKEIRKADEDQYNASWIKGISLDGAAGKGWSIKLGDHSTDATDFASYSFRNWWNMRLTQVTHLGFDILTPGPATTTNSGGSPRISLQVEDAVNGATTGTIFLDPSTCSDPTGIIEPGIGEWMHADFFGDVTNCTITDDATRTYSSDGAETAWHKLITSPEYANKRVYFAFLIADATTGTNYIDKIQLDGLTLTNKP